MVLILLNIRKLIVKLLLLHFKQCAEDSNKISPFNWMSIKQLNISRFLLF